MDGPIPSDVFWKNDDWMKKNEAIQEAERLRNRRNAEEHRAAQREFLAGIQGQTSSRVPKRCRQADKCPLADSNGFGASIPSACFWSCGVTNENRNA